MQTMAKEKLTYELVDKAVDMKAHGLNDCDIAAALGVAKGTFSRWMNKPNTKLQRALCERLKKAESDYKETLLNTIMEAALAKNGNWTAAAWLLERKYPEEYAQNRQRADAGAEVPQIVLGVKVEAATGDGKADAKDAGDACD